MDFGLLIPSMQDWQFALSQFFQTGGWVLYPILLVAMLMALLIIERSLFRFFHYPGYKQTTLNAVQSQQKPETQLSILCDLDLALKNQLAMIKTLIAICPLIGLLGTITGMVQVFDSLALYGTGNPRLMAAGVASATFPTMTGMAVAAIGVLFFNRLSRWSDNERRLLQLLISPTGPAAKPRGSV